MADNSNNNDFKVRTFSVSCYASEEKLEIIGAESTFVDALKENKCLTKLLDGQEQYHWRGSIVVLRRNEHATYNDIKGAHLYMLKKYFIERMSRKRKRFDDDYGHACNFDLPGLTAKDQIKGVMISCAGDMKDFGHHKFSQVVINEGALIKNPIRSPARPICNFLGFHFEFYAFDSGAISSFRGESEEGNASSPYSNLEMSNLFIEFSAVGTIWGEVRGIDSASPGSFLVIRVDRHKLHPQQVEALECYIHMILPEMEASRRQAAPGGIYQAKIKIRDQFLTRENFETFLEKYKKMKFDEGFTSWTGAWVPYTTGVGMLRA